MEHLTATGSCKTFRTVAKQAGPAQRLLPHPFPPPPSESEREVCVTAAAARSVATGSHSLHLHGALSSCSDPRTGENSLR
ncbi:hypothetical protein ZWY2020_041270 [Hordeum vulgare]|nr:hypothetical protein ZWY2020_041270 [Hordeum vulgare]